jgi:hypothetical protein
VVNFQKMRAIFAQQREMLLFQRHRYAFPAPQPLCAELSQTLKVLADDALYERSLAFEPRT